MKLNLDLKSFKVGMRTFKTTIAVGLTITLFELLNRQPAVLAAIAAVFTDSDCPLDESALTYLSGFRC